LDPDVTPVTEKKKNASLEKLTAPLEQLLAVLKALAAPLRILPGTFTKLLSPLKTLPAAFKNLPLPKNLPIPKQLMLPVLAGAGLLIVGGVAFGIVQARSKHAAAPNVKVVASAPSAASSADPAGACSGVVRDIYRQTVSEDPSVTLAEVRSEVLSSGVSCAPDPELAAELKDLSPACRDMVQYTYLGVRDGHTEVKVSDVREKVVEKSVACEHDRRRQI
jgi:hypothetical protein